MTLRAQLFGALGAMVLLTALGVGALVRTRWQTERQADFARDLAATCTRIAADVRTQAESDLRLVKGACGSGAWVDRARVALEAGEVDERRPALAALVQLERQAFGLDELLLATFDGDVLGAEPRGLANQKPADLTREGAAIPNEGAWTVRRGDGAALEARCASGSRRMGVWIRGGRSIGPLVERLGRTAGVSATLHAPRTEADTAVVYCDVQRPDGAPSDVRLFVQASTANVRADLARIDQNVAIVALGALALAVVLSALTARRLARPLGRLADEAARVAAGDAKPIAPSGPTEVRALAHAFSQMLDDLARTRRRLDAASRIAAWSEVAKRVAHEVKNPLSPIRASIETLRRLRGRDDGAFADYFDEATATVLSEVRRLTVLVDEFTRFARLPAPRPERFDVTQCVREICTLHRSAVPVDVESPPSPVMLLADRHQVVQVVTNLLANAIDACGSLPGGRVRVTVTADAASVTVSVEDNGPGVPTSFEPRLFEPYATGKEQGTGLGLALSQRIAVEHGGDLSYERNALGGAHFRLTLPQRTGHGNGGDASARQVGEESLRTSVDPMDPPAS